MSRKKKLKKIRKLLELAQSGEFAVRGRDFGRGVSFLAREIEAILNEDRAAEEPRQGRR